jgi:hypothetical protein
MTPLDNCPSKALISLVVGRSDLIFCGMDIKLNNIIKIQRLWRQCLKWKRINKHIPMSKDLKEYVLKPFIVTVDRRNLNINHYIDNLLQIIHSGRETYIW